ncbi:unnamed protein product, partial [Staurois parvus]
MSCQSAPGLPHQFLLIIAHQCSLSMPISSVFQCP